MSSQSAPSYPFDGPGLILAHAYYPYEFGEFGGDIHFDEDEAWAVNATDYSSGRMDFFTVAQHEIGAAQIVNIDEYRCLIVTVFRSQPGPEPQPCVRQCDVPLLQVGASAVLLCHQW